VAIEKKKDFNASAGMAQCAPTPAVIFSIPSQAGGFLTLRQTTYVSPMVGRRLKMHIKMCMFQWGIIIPWNKTRNMLFMERLQVAITIVSLFNPMNALFA
jgi:hypothetical protein